KLLALAAAELLVAARETGLGLRHECLRLPLDGRPGLRRKDLVDGDGRPTVLVQLAHDAELRRVQRGPVRRVQRASLAVREDLVVQLVRVLDPGAVQVAGALLHPRRRAAHHRLARSVHEAERYRPSGVINATSALWRGLRLVGPGQATSARARGLAALPA